MNKLLIFLLFFLIFALSLRFILFFSDRPKLYDREELNFEATLFSEPTLSGRIQKISVDYQTHKIFITTTILPEYHYGDKINISGTLKIKLLNDKNVLYSMTYPKIVAKNDNKNAVLAIVSSIRQKIISFFSQNLSQNYSGLMLGIVFGIKEKIPPEFLKILRYSGVMHVIAASGMNVTMVGGFLSSLFSLFLRRQVALAISIIGIVAYTIFAGLEASIIRASIMGILVFTAQILGRQSWPGFILIVTGFVMLFWDPSLIFDIGFQLSFLATIGLLYFPTPVKQASSSPILDTFQTTIFAQIATLPVIIANFGFYSLWSVIVNALVLWTIPPIMVIGGISSLMSFVAEPLARAILFLSLPLLIYFDTVIRFFNNLGGLVNFSLNWLEIVGYYSLVAGLVLIRKK